MLTDQAEKEDGNMRAILLVVVLIIYSFLCITSVWMLVGLGEADLSNLSEPSGRFGVGVRRIWTKRHSQHALCFYPVEK